MATKEEWQKAYDKTKKDYDELNAEDKTKWDDFKSQIWRVTCINLERLKNKLKEVKKMDKHTVKVCPLGRTYCKGCEYINWHNIPQLSKNRDYATCQHPEEVGKHCPLPIV